MAWVITRLCADCQDTACVKVCPVDCIYGLNVDDVNFRKQLFIDPEECINCAAYQPTTSRSPQRCGTSQGLESTLPVASGEKARQEVGSKTISWFHWSKSRT